MRQEHIENLVKEIGAKRTSLFLSSLAKQSKLIEVLDTDFGKEIMNEAIERVDFLLRRIIDEKSTEEDRAEFRVLKTILNRWCDKILAYKAGIEKITKEK